MAQLQSMLESEVSPRTACHQLMQPRPSSTGYEMQNLASMCSKVAPVLHACLLLAFIVERMIAHKSQPCFKIRNDIQRICPFTLPTQC